MFHFTEGALWAQPWVELSFAPGRTGPSFGFLRQRAHSLGERGGTNTENNMTNVKVGSQAQQEDSLAKALVELSLLYPPRQVER